MSVPGHRRSPAPRARRVGVVAVSVVLAVGVAACSDDAAPDLAAGERLVESAWSRTTPAGATSAVVYMTVRSGSDDALTGVSVPNDIAAAADLHTTTAGDAGGHEHHGGGGDAEASDVVSMVGVEEFLLEADGTLVFEPGGNHVMLTGLVAPLAAGTTFPLTLEFSSGAAVDVTVTVSDNPPG